MFYSPWRSFIVVVQEGNITRAAERLHITQQSLSRQIAKLEEDYDTVFFERKPHLRLTSAGRCFYEYAKEALEHEKTFFEKLNEFRQQKKGYLSLGVTHIRSQTILPRLLPKFVEQFPGIETEVKICPFQELDKKLLAGELDLIIRIRRRDSTPLVSVTDFTQDQLCLAVPWRFCRPYFPNIERANAFNMMSVEERWQKITQTPVLQEIPYLLAGPSCIRIAKKLFKKYVPDPHILMELPESEPVFLLGFKEQAGVISCKSIFDHFFSGAEGEKFALLPFFDPQIQIRVVLGYDPERSMTWEAKEFLKFAVNEFSEEKIV